MTLWRHALLPNPDRFDAAMLVDTTGFSRGYEAIPHAALHRQKIVALQFQETSSGLPLQTHCGLLRAAVSKHTMTGHVSIAGHDHAIVCEDTGASRAVATWTYQNGQVGSVENRGYFAWGTPTLPPPPPPPALVRGD